MESAIDVKPLGFIPGSLLATDARSELAIIRKTDDSQLGFYEFLEQGDGPDVIQCRCEVLSSNLKEVKRHPSRDVVYLLERSEEASTWYWVDLALGEKKQLVRSKPTRRKLQVVPHPNFPVVALVQDSIDLFDLESQEFARREVEKTNPTAMLGQLQWIEGSMDFAIAIDDRVILVEDTERSAAMNSKRGESRQETLNSMPIIKRFCLSFFRKRMDRSQSRMSMEKCFSSGLRNLPSRIY